MPKKPNRAAQLQNYVPAGNGDASGEYADEETGSNIHFTNFKKPDGTDGYKIEDFDKSIVEGLDEIEESFDEKKLVDDLDEITDEKNDQDNGDEVIDDLDNSETKNGILNLNPDLDKEKVMALNDKDANKLLKAINDVDKFQNKYDKLKKDFTTQEIEGIWLEKQTIPSLIDKFGSVENVMNSLQNKQEWGIANKPELVTQIDDLLSKGFQSDLEKYFAKKQKLDNKYQKAKDLISKFEDPNNLYSQEKKDNAIWCKSISETKKYFPSISTKGLTNAEEKALTHYTSTFNYINEPLRGIKYGNIDKSKKDMFINSVKNMTSAIDKSVIDFDFWTQRGTKAVNFPHTKINSSSSIEELQSLVGTSFEDQAFVSTGAAKSTGFSTEPIILNIYCPKGTKGAYVDDISNFKGENELILQRGYSYKVTKVEKKGGKIYMDCDLILGSDKNKYNDAQLEEINKKYFY